MGLHAFERVPTEPDDAAGRPAVDLVHLARQTLGDRELESELLGLFVRQARGVLDTLTTASAETGHLPSWGCDPLHMLCGSARAVGCWQVATEAQALEEEIRAAALGQATIPARGRLEGLDLAVRTACAAIQTLVEE